MPTDPRAPLLPSLTNFRDLGGVSLGDRTLETGLFYRSPRPTDLSARDLGWLGTCGIDRIVDFRGIDESAAAPMTLGANLMARRLSLPVEPSMSDRLRRLNAGEDLTESAVARAMTESYRAYVTANLDTFGAFLRVCAAARGPVIFHCSAGKDRTGFAAALLLSALGASWTDILADYLRTLTDWQVPDDLRDQARAANRAALLGVDAAYLAAAFDELETGHWGAGTFARFCLGGAGPLEKFRTRVSRPGP